MRLLAYLFVSYLAIYLANVPVHHGLVNPIVPALVPWLAAAAVAAWRVYKKQDLTPAWLTLAGAGVFLLLGHVIPK